MKYLRRSLIVLLCAVIAVTSVLFVSTAGETVLVPEDHKYPLIIVPGYSSASMYVVKPDNPKKHIWRIDFANVAGRIVNNAVDVGLGLFQWAVGNPKMISERVGQELLDMCGDMAYDEDGKPVAELHCYHTAAAEVNSAYLFANEDGKYRHEIEIVPYVAQDLGEKSNEWTFNFNTDFRQNIIFCARDLATLIKDVKQYTGQDQVNIIAVSHGGQISATYLSLCAIAAKGGAQAKELAGHLDMTVKELTELFDAKDVHNAALTVPAIGGALLAYDVLTNRIVFDEETLLYFVEYGMTLDTDYNWLFKAQQLGFLDEMLGYFQPYLMQVLGHWGSMWDFVPLDSYETVKQEVASERFLRSDVIAQSDYFHYNIMNRMAENLQAAEGLGINVYLVAGSGLPSIVGTQECSDAIISVKASSGATVAPLGQRFANGYQTRNTQCKDPAHNHLSPAMDIDLSTGYLPETTWIVNRYFHGMMYKDDYVRDLLKTLIESDSRVTVHDKEEFPQFHEAMNVSESVYAEFDTSKTGFVSADDHALTIKNLSKDSRMILLSVTTDNPSIRFSAKQSVGKAIAPQDSITLDFGGTLQPKSLETMHITVSYYLVTSVTPVNEKTFTFTLMNGEADPYEESRPFVDAGAPAQHTPHRLSNTIFGRLLKKTNLGAILSLFYRIFGRYIDLLFRH